MIKKVSLTLIVVHLIWSHSCFAQDNFDKYLSQFVISDYM